MYVGGYEVTGWCAAGLSLQSGIWVAIASLGQTASDKKLIQTLAIVSFSLWPLDSGLAGLTSRRIVLVPVFSRFLDLNWGTLCILYGLCCNFHSKFCKDFSGLCSIPSFSLAVIVKNYNW